MTKMIRIENADLSGHPVRVTVQHKVPSGEWVNSACHAPVQLDSPTAQTSQYIHSGQRLVIEELSADDAS